MVCLVHNGNYCPKKDHVIIAAFHFVQSVHHVTAELLFTHGSAKQTPRQCDDDKHLRERNIFFLFIMWPVELQPTIVLVFD